MPKLHECVSKAVACSSSFCMCGVLYFAAFHHAFAQFHLFLLLRNKP